MDGEQTMKRVREVVGEGRRRPSRSSSSSRSSATGSPIDSPLMDAIATWVDDARPGAEVVRPSLPAFTDSRWSARVPGLRRLRLLSPARAEPLRGLAADPRRRRAHRRARPRLRARLLPRAARRLLR
jgi:hypothetical protein